MDIPKRVWNHVNRSGWPIDTPDYVLFARAAPKIGRHLHGDAWHDSDLTAVPIPMRTASLPPSLESASISNTERAWDLIQRAAPERPHPGFRDIEAQALRGSKPVLLSNEDWELARRIERESVANANRAAEPGNAGYNRLQKLLEFLVTELVWGRQAAAIKDYQEDMRPVPAKLWNNKQVTPWILIGRIPGITINGTWFDKKEPDYWLFLDRHKIEILLSTQMPRPQNLGSDIYISPYVQLMIDTIREFALSDADQGKVESIQTFVDAEWIRRGFRESEKLRTAIPTLIRDPASQRGRGAPTRKKG